MRGEATADSGRLGPSLLRFLLMTRLTLHDEHTHTHTPLRIFPVVLLTIRQKKALLPPPLAGAI